MSHNTRFWLGLLGRLGPPLFAATLVACLLSQSFDRVHGALMAAGGVMIYLHHRFLEDRERA